MSDPCSSHFYKMHNGSLNITVSEGTKDSLSPCLSGDNRCLTSRLGVDMAEEVSPGGMESFSTSMSNNCRLGSEALLALSQHLRSVSHQPARRERLLKWAHPWLASLRTMHHPSRANSVADYLSHQGLDGGCILRKSSWSRISTGSHVDLHAALWDLALVLQALSKSHFEPIAGMTFLLSYRLCGSR